MAKTAVERARADGRLAESENQTGFYLNDETPKTQPA
jgi:hypothetical protein